MPVLSPEKKQLTIKTLHHDTVGSQLGYWPVKTKLRGRPINYIIVKETKGFVLVTARSLSFIGHAPTLPAIINVFNNQLAEEQVVIE